MQNANGVYRERARNAIIRVFQYVGEQCVAESRQSGKYVDRTGNLRSSIGYAVIYGGKVVRSGGVAGGGDGKANADQLLSTLTGKVSAYFSGGVTLVVVAGMNYATYVEAMGLNVLSSGKLLAERLVPEMMKKIGFEMKTK